MGKGGNKTRRKRWDIRPIVLTNKTFTEINKRFDKLNKKIQNRIKKNIDDIATPIEPGNRFVYEYKTDFQNEFLKWLRKALNEDILEGKKLKKKQDSWFNNPIAGSYSNGVIFTDEEYNYYAKLFEKEHRRKLISKFNPLRNPYHIIRARQIFARNFEQLKGVTDEIAAKMTNIITRSILIGDSPLKLARELNKKVTLGKKRCKLIARTEIANAQSVASINECQRIEDDENLEGEVLMLWQTSEDSKVRPSHKRRNGKHYKKEVALKLVGEPNCRCVVIPDWEEYYVRTYES